MGRHRQLRILLTIATVCTGAMWSFQARAANLQYAADYLNRQQANITSGIEHYLFFTPATNLPGAGNVIRLAFTSSPGNTWCRVGGVGLGVLGITSPPGTTEGATPLPGALSASCTIGDGVTTFDTIFINGINPLVAGTKYGVAITDPGTPKLGTPPTQSSVKLELTTNNGASDIDSLLFYTATIVNDRVVVSAVVAEPPVPQNPVVRFAGYVGSGANVIITRGGTSVRTATLGLNGVIDETLTEQPTGDQVYVVSAIDASGRSFTPVTFVLNLTMNSTTDLSNIFLGPTISAAPSSAPSGDVITVTGITVPLSVVTVTISTSPLTTYTATANTSGVWQRVINSADFGVGTFFINARSLFNSLLSSLSPQISVSVTEPTTNTNTNTSTNTNNNTNSTINTNSNVNRRPPVVPPSTFAITDLNRDGKVNLTDFSILMFYWQQRNPGNAETDINQDNVVDIIDISIMLYQWTPLV